MTQLKTIVIIGFILTLVLVGASMLMKSDVNMTLGSADTGDYSVVMHETNAATTTKLVTGPCRLGSVIITEDATNAVSLYSATSTTAYALTNGTKIADFQASQAEGVYPFDVYVPGNLYLQDTNSTAFGGDWSITYKY